MHNPTKDARGSQNLPASRTAHIQRDEVRGDADWGRGFYRDVRKANGGKGGSNLGMCGDSA